MGFFPKPRPRARFRPYVGIRPDGSYEVFQSTYEPTLASHGQWYSAIIGPFKTIRAARWAKKYGKGNPHFTCVEDAERISLKEMRMIKKLNRQRTKKMKRAFT